MSLPETNSEKHREKSPTRVLLKVVSKFSKVIQCDLDQLSILLS